MREVRDKRYYSCVSDILENPSFRRLSSIRHHDATIMSHVVRVSRFSFWVCDVLGWNSREAARGGLLHDFFLYDWRDPNDPAKPSGLHAFAHPVVAAENARIHFTISKREEDIIIKHMWPLPLKLPRYRESWVIVVVDKVVAAYEFGRAGALRLTASFRKCTRPIHGLTSRYGRGASFRENGRTGSRRRKSPGSAS